MLHIERPTKENVLKIGVGVAKGALPTPSLHRNVQDVKKVWSYGRRSRCCIRYDDGHVVVGGVVRPVQVRYFVRCEDTQCQKNNNRACDSESLQNIRRGRYEVNSWMDTL